jgi:haloalkane dehalogenase
MKVLRTPDERFGEVPDFPYEPRYTEVADGDGGTLRIHHVDEGPADGPVVLCMHGQPTWSFLYRHMIPILTDAGLRVVAPDLVGFGRSDKPAALEDFSYNGQVAWMNAWLDANDLRGVTFVGQDWGGLIGLRLVADNPERFDRVAISNTGLPLPRALPQDRIDAVKEFRANAPTPSMSEMGKALSGRLSVPNELRFAYWQKWSWETADIPVAMIIAGTMRDAPLSPGELAAYDAPFPDASYKMGPRAMPSLVPTLPADPPNPPQAAAWEVFSEWRKPFLCAFTDDDPVTRGGDAPFREKVPGAAGQPHITIEGGGHFLQETRAKEFSQVIIEAIERPRDV